MATKRVVAITLLYTHANNRRSPVRFPPSEDVCVPARGAEGVLWDPLGHRLRLTCFRSTSDRQPGNGDDRAINPGFTFC